MKYHETPEFQELRRFWYARAAEDGFEDIEQVVDDKGTVGALLLGVSTGDLRRNLYKGETEDYYRYARQYLHSLPGWSLARKVWELHSEGYSASKGVRELRARGIEITTGAWTRIVKRERRAMLDDLDRDADRNAKAAIAAWEDDADAQK